MTSMIRLKVLGSALVVLSGCGRDDGGEQVDRASVPVLRQQLGVDLASVASMVALSGASGSEQAQPAAAGSSSTTRALDADGGPLLLALTSSGDVVEVSLVEEGNPAAEAPIVQPRVTGIAPTASWVLFSAPNVWLTAASPTDEGRGADVSCSIIAARREDGALFCAPLVSNNGWAGRDVESTISANAAGDVVYTMAALTGDVGEILEETFQLYRIELGRAEGPVAAPALDVPLFGVGRFRVNGAGDLLITYFPTALDGVARTQIVPLDGSAPFTVEEGEAPEAIAGRAGDPDEDTFYVAAIGGGRFGGTIRVISKTGSSFVETQGTVSLTNVDAYRDLFRLRDGVYMFNRTDKTLASVIADGVVVPEPTTVALTGVDRVLGIDGGGEAIAPVGGFWVFIAASGDGFKFVRHDGTAQQDIPLDASVDVWSFTTSSTGAIDFLGFRTGTAEKIRGSVAAGSTDVIITPAGVLDPAQVVAFTPIN